MPGINANNKSSKRDRSQTFESAGVSGIIDAHPTMKIVFHACLATRTTVPPPSAFLENNFLMNS